MNFNNILLSFFLLLLISTSSKSQEKNAQQKPPDVLKLDKVFPGPFRDTVIQRVIDEKNGIICYVYAPVVAEPSKVATEKTPRVYGPNYIGSISCLKK